MSCIKNVPLAKAPRRTVSFVSEIIVFKAGRLARRIFIFPRMLIPGSSKNRD